MPGGRHLIHAYYKVGPDAAAVIDRNGPLKDAVKGALILFAGLSIPLTLFGPFGTMLFTALLVGAVVYRRRRRK